MNQALQQVRQEYESMNWLALLETAKKAGIEPGGKSRAQVVDELMAVEEYACFH